MNTDQYLQMLQMQQQPSAQPIQSMAPQSLQRFDPLSSGAAQAINSVRQSMGYRPTQGQPNAGESLFEGLDDAFIGNLRGDPNATVQGMGHGMRTGQEERDLQQIENMKIMKFLQEAEEAKRLQEHHNAQLEHQRAQLAEQHRYHNMQREHWNSSGSRVSAQDAKTLREEKKEREVLERTAALQEKEPGAVYLKDLPTYDMNSNIKAQQEAIKSLPAKRLALKEAKTLYDLVKNNPGVISDDFVKAISDKEGQLPAPYRIAKSITEKGRKKLDVLDAFRKGINVINRNKIEGMAGVRQNMFLEKMVAGGSGQQGMTDKALEDNFKKMIDNLKHSIEGDELIQKDKARGIYNVYNFGRDMDYDPSETTIGKKPIKDKPIPPANGLQVRDSSGRLVQIPEGTPQELVDAILQEAQAGAR